MKKIITSVTIIGIVMACVSPTFAIEESYSKLDKLEIETQTSIESKVEKLQSIEIPEIPTYDIPLSKELQEYTYKLCKEMDIEYELALAIMKKESNFNADLVSGVNKNGTIDYGIMQLNSSHVQWQADLAEVDITEYDALNPYHNIKAGLGIYKNSQDAWEGQIDDEILQEVALLSYNRGVGGAKKYMRENGTIYHSYNIQVLEYKNEL